MAKPAAPALPQADVNPTPIQHRIGALVRDVTAGVIAGGIAGVIAGGVGGRIAMRVTALMATSAEQGTLTEAEETVGEITLGGSLGLIVFGGMLVGMLGGLLYAAVERWVADAGPWRGALFGLGLLIATGWTIIEGDNFDFATLGSANANMAMFAAIFVVFGLLVAPVYAWVRRRLGRPSLSVRGLLSLPVYAIGILFGAMVLAITATAFGEDGREAPMYVLVPGYVLVVSPLATVWLRRRAGRFDRLSDLRHDTRGFGAALAVMGVPLVAGAVLDIQSLVEILGDAY